MMLPRKKWLFIIGLIIITCLVLVCIHMLAAPHSVSNRYIIPAGEFSLSPVLPSLHPALPPANVTPVLTTTPVTPLR
jgi:hypothetical protein